MITKGIITAIDYNTNTCTLRLPIFEGVGNKNKLIFNGTFCIPPGVYNGYIVNDVVFVGFEDNELSDVVVIGKLYLGQQEEANSTNIGAVYSNTLKVTNKAVLPADTQIGNVKISDIISKISSQDTEINTGKDDRVESILTDIIGAEQNVSDIIGED